MKLASYEDGSRDGQLVVVSRDLKTAHYATAICRRMQHLLDDWGFLSPQLQDIYDALNQGRLRHAFEFESGKCAAPLPRAFAHFLDASGPVSEGAGALPQDASRTLDESATHSPLRQVASDFFGASRQPFAPAQPGATLHVSAGLAVILGDVPVGAGPEQAIDGVRLITLTAQSWLPVAGQPDDGASMRASEPPGFGMCFAAVAVTPDEFGRAWQAGRVHRPIDMKLNRQPATSFDGAGMRRHFGELAAEACLERPLTAGTLIGSLFARRSESGQAESGRLVVEMRGEAGGSMFGAIAFAAPSQSDSSTNLASISA